MNQHESLRVALEDAQGQGFTCTFTMVDGGLECRESGKVYTAADITVVDHDRFEGSSSEDDMAVLYRVSAADGCNGTIVDAFGTYADEALADFLRKMGINENT